MKKDIFKKLLAITVAAVLCVTLFACGSNQEKETETTTIAASTNAETSAETTAEVLDKSPITLTMGMQSQNCTIGDGIHQEYSVLKEITAQTGVTLDFVTYDVNKFKVLAAGGDLPDLICVEGSDSTVAGTLIDSGALLQLDDLLGKYGENILNNIPKALKWSKEIVGKGKTYLIPVVTSSGNTSSPAVSGGAAFVARYDIYKAIGSPNMSGEDDFLNVLKQMQDYQRKATGDNKIYALSAWSDWGLWPYIVSYPFANGYGNAANNHSLNMVTGEMEHNFLKEDSIFWKGLYFFNKAYRLGVFEPEALTMKWAQYGDKVYTGKVITGAASFLGIDNKACGENAILVHLPGAFPYIPGVYDSDNPYGYQRSGARSINASCKYPERAMQLMNYFDSEVGARTLKNGIMGVDWDISNGKAKLIGPRLDAIKNGTLADYEKANPTSLGGENYVSLAMFWSSGEFKTSDGLPIDLANTLEMKLNNATPVQKGFAQDYDTSFSYPGQVYEKWVKEGLAKTTTSTPEGAFLLSNTSAESQQTESKAAEYVSANMAKLILAKDEAEFNSVKAFMINDIKAMGVEASEAEFQKNYSDANILVNSFNN